ncbi:MAG: pyridoxal phosphate-dependent aminotransferase, partial [Tissierellia bacterium]|nr:pyridoxal phosphate-dependent aminotransferase [Tissierellia bacterium]
MKYSDNASKLKPSITLSITAKAKELKAKGKDVIGFGAGEPDFDTPDHIVKACKDALDSGKTKYIPASGLPELKEAVKNKLKRDNNLEYDNNQIIITTGGKQALSNVFTAMLNPGDEVMMAIPYWVTYPDLVSLNGGVNVFVETEKENDYKYTKENLLKFVSEKTKILVLNSPSNPLGVVYSKGELTMIADFCKEHDIFIISDEIYEPLVYDNEEHISIASLSEDAFNRTLTVNSLSKSYSMTGWRIGYAAGPLKLIKLMTTIQSHT